MKPVRFILLIVALYCTAAPAAEVIPPAPAHYFNDAAHIVDAVTANRLDQKLADFEKQTSNQFVVAVYATMQSDSSIEDYTVRVAQKWGVGQKDRKNGVVLFVFIGDRKMYIQVGYGLEGALPDATAKSIIENEIRPRFRSGDFAGGLTAGVDAIIAATKGEYTAKPVPSNSGNWDVLLFFLVVFALIVMYAIWSSRHRSVVYSRRGRGGWGPILWGGAGGWGGGGSWGGGGGGFSGGGFSGGGGSFGGGGAGGGW